jgi:hypothetical protein
MKNGATQELYAYWNTLRGARPAPRRDEVDPIAIPHSLPEIFLLELQEGGRIAVRLAGTRLCELYGRELRGISASSLWSAQSRSEVDKVLRDVMAEAAVAVIAADARKEGRSVGAFELVVTPLADAAGTCRYIIGALACTDPQAAHTLYPIDALEARSARLSWPSGLRDDEGARPPQGDARQIGRFLVYDGGLEPAPEPSTLR